MLSAAELHCRLARRRRCAIAAAYPLLYVVSAAAAPLSLPLSGQSAAQLSAADSCRVVEPPHCFIAAVYASKSIPRRLASSSSVPTPRRFRILAKAAPLPLRGL